LWQPTSILMLQLELLVVFLVSFAHFVDSRLPRLPSLTLCSRTLVNSQRNPISCYLFIVHTITGNAWIWRQTSDSELILKRSYWTIIFIVFTALWFIRNIALTNISITAPPLRKRMWQTTLLAKKACSTMQKSIIEIDKGCSTMSISNTISVVDQIGRGRSTLYEIGSKSTISLC
jgi:hypothetical protein